MRILLVEDEKKVASFIKKGLEEEFYSVDAVYDGKEGLRLALTEDYDLIILDIMIPFKDGFTVLQELRKEKVSIPVLFLTAKDTLSDKVQGLNFGADDYLPKPFAFEELLEWLVLLLHSVELIIDGIPFAFLYFLTNIIHYLSEGPFLVLVLILVVEG